MLSLTLDSHEELVQVPFVAQTIRSSLESPAVLGPELPTPLSDGLVGRYDATLGHEVLNVT